MGLHQSFIDEILRRILSVTTPDRVILFGSAAVGEMDEDSDVDLMILDPHLDAASQASRQLRSRIRHALYGMDTAFDLIVMPTDAFEREKDVVGTAAWPANAFGKVVYEAASGENKTGGGERSEFRRDRAIDGAQVRRLHRVATRPMG